MNAQNQQAKATTTPTTKEELMRKAAQDGVDALQCAVDTLEQCEALFHTIQEQSDGRAKALATLGQYMAGDWENMTDCSREDLAKAVQL